MSRHRLVHAIDVDEEYEGYYSCYGHSVEDDHCISPQTESQFLYDRNAKKQNISSFLNPTEEESSEEDNSVSNVQSFDELNDVDTAKLHSCVEAMQNVVGDTITEDILKNAAVAYDFDVERALNSVLTDSVSEPQKLGIGKKLGETSGKTFKSIGCKTDNKTSAITTLKPEDTTDGSEKNISGPSKLTKLKPVASGFKQLSVENSPRISRQRSPARAEMVNPCEIISPKSTIDVAKIYKEERGHCKPIINLVVVGHVDAGKSTLMGHLLHKLGEVSKKAMHRFEQDSKKIGKSSFMYAWVLDETPEERNRGITMDVAQSKFETPNREVTLLDAPGHKDFIPNMIIGAAQADVALLVIDSTPGEFETGFEAGGQTREHTMLIRSLGVTQVAVVINKMDNVQWSEQRYNGIINKLSLFIKQTVFQESNCVFVPCSGLTGENLLDPPQSPELKKWYKGPTLVEVIDNFRVPERLIEKSLRMCVNDVFKGISGGFCVSGKIETGFAKSGDKIIVMPSAELATIKALSVNDVSHEYVFAGDHTIMQLAGIDVTTIQRGSMVCGIGDPIKSSTRFQAQLVIFGIKFPITKGSPMVIHYQSVSEQAILKKLIAQLHRGTGEVVKKNPRCLAKNSSALVEIETSLPICIELYKDCKGLGRFMLRSQGFTVAAGVVTKIL